MKFELEAHNRNVPEDELIADLKRVAGELQKSSVTVDEYNERGRFHATTLIRRLKRPWLKVLELAGLSKTRNLHISKEELFDNLVDVWRKLGRQPKYSDLTSQTSKYSSGTYEYRFGTWRKALEAFVVWANESEAQPVEASLEKRASRHRTSRKINYRLTFLVMRRDNFKCRITGRFSCH